MTSTCCATSAVVCVLVEGRVWGGGESEHDRRSPIVHTSSRREREANTYAHTHTQEREKRDAQTHRPAAR